MKFRNARGPGADLEAMEPQAAPEEAGGPGERGRKPGRAKRWAIRVIIIAICVTLFFVWNSAQNKSVETTTYRVFSDKIDEPVRVAFLSDLHQWSFGKGNSKLIKTVEDAEPDVILIGGDMLNDVDPDIDLVLELCQGLTEIAPVYYSMGNHENKVVYGMNLYLEDLEEAGVFEGDTEDFSELVVDPTLYDGLEKLGVQVLQNSDARIEVNGNTLLIGGVSTGVDGFWPYSGKFFSRFEKTKGDAFKIIISHFPSTVSKYIDHDDYTIDLALSGHNHGGIVRIPGIGGLMTFDEGFLPKDDAGERMINDMTFIISRGLGNHGLIPRIFNKPELVVIDIF